MTMLLMENQNQKKKEKREEKKNPCLHDMLVSIFKMVCPHGE